MKLNYLCSLLLSYLTVLNSRNAHKCTSNQFWNKYLCVPCNENCECSDVNGCDKCIEGSYYKDTTAKSCKVCSYKCKTCTDQFTCAECKDNFLLLNGTCFNPEIQQESYKFNLQDLFPLQSPNRGSCIQANVTNFTCTSCNENQFETINGDCKDCPFNCKTCLMQGQCSECLPGYRWNAESCEECTSKCTQCSNGYTCTQCQDYYYLSTGLNPECKVCDAQKYCKKCTSETLCILCDTIQNLVFEIVNGKCEAKGCPSNCDTCDSTYTKCTQCQDQYYLLNDACKSCSSKLSQTQYCENDDPLVDAPYPTQCYSNSILIYPSADLTGAPKCVSNFQGCLKSKADSTVAPVLVCEECQPEYLSLKDGSCYQIGQISNCISEVLDSNGNPKCSSCQLGYNLDNNQCKSCNSQFQQDPSKTSYDGCLTCTASDCTQCLENYRKSSSKELLDFNRYCLKCPSSCKNCDETSCTACQTDYLLYNGNCYQNIAFCKTLNGTTCSECLVGFRLDSGICRKCISSLGQWFCDVNAGFDQERIDACTKNQGALIVFSLILIKLIL